MLNKKEKRALLILDIVEAILSVVAIAVFTLVFRLDKTYARYLFLLGDCYVIYCFSKILSNLEKKIEKHFVKKSHKSIESKCIKELSI